MTRSTFLLIPLAILAGCTASHKRGHLVGLERPLLVAAADARTVRDDHEARRARDRALDIFRPELQQRLRSIPIRLAASDRPGQAAAYQRGCGGESIVLYYSPTDAAADWDRKVSRRARGGGGGTWTARMTYSGFVHRRVRLSLERPALALTTLREGIRDELTAILVHEYTHALIVDGRLDAGDLADRLDALDRRRYPIADLIDVGWASYPWWLAAMRDDEMACMAAEYHLVFGFALPDDLARTLATIGTPEDRGPIQVHVDAR